MTAKASDILQMLDICCDAFSFPMLDNGYVYLAATRLSLHRSDEDWAMVIEVFGFSPRAGLPDTFIHTFASRLAIAIAPNSTLGARPTRLTSQPTPTTSREPSFRSSRATGKPLIRTSWSRSMRRMSRFEDEGLLCRLLLSTSGMASR